MRGPNLKTAYIDQWKGGMDTRTGLFSDTLKSFREMTNCVVTVSGNLISRPPVKSFNVTLDSKCQGWLYNNGTWYTVAKRGDVVTHTGANAGLVTTLYFDNPDFYSSSWTLNAFYVYRGKPVAWITHTYQGQTITSRLWLHTWDNKIGFPTYVTDPYAPQSWSLGTWPIWPYSQSGQDIGSFSSYIPVYETAGEKVVTSSADGASRYSAISRARVWNTRSADDIEKTGQMYYFTMPYFTSPGGALFPIPEVKADLQDVSKFASYVVEKLTSGGAWTRLTEGVEYVTSTSYVPPNAWWTSSNMMLSLDSSKISQDTLVRIRCCVTPEVRITSGGTYSPSNITITGDGALTDFNMGVPYSGFTSTWSGTIAGTSVSSYYDVVDISGNATVQFKRFAQTITIGSNASVRALAVTKVSGGVGYVTGDKIDIVGTGGGSSAVSVRCTVTAVAGVVTALAIDSPNNDYLQIPSGTLNTTAFTGTGVGLTVTVTWDTNVAAVLSGLSYVAVADTTNITTSLTLNGSSFTAFTTVAGSPSTSYTWIVWNTPSAVSGQQLSGKTVLVNGKQVFFDASAALIAGGTCTFEGSTFTFPAGLKTILSSVPAYIGVQVSGGTATVVAIPTTSVTSTPSILYNVFVIGSVNAFGAYTPFRYSYIANTEWYSKRHLDNLSYWKGEGEAGFINTASRNPRGGVLTAMKSVKNRIVFCYPQSTQLWQFDPDPALNSYIDRYDFGTSSPLALFYDQVLLNSQRGPRLFELTGFNYQALTDTNVGEALNSIGSVGITAATFWPWFGGYVAFGSVSGADLYAERAKLPTNSVLRLPGTQYGFWILSFSKESQTSAWSWNPVSGITSVQWSVMSPIDERVYFVSGQSVYYLDGKATDVIDAPSGVAMTCRAITHFSHLDNPGVVKRCVSLDSAMNGSLSISASMQPWGDGKQPQWGPALLDSTIGTPTIPFGFTSVALSLDMRSIDRFELQFLDIKYIMGGRK